MASLPVPRNDDILQACIHTDLNSEQAKEEAKIELERWKKEHPEYKYVQKPVLKPNGELWITY